MTRRSRLQRLPHLAGLTLKRVGDATVARIPRPVHIHGGGWMVTWADAAGVAVRKAQFEPGEAIFVERFLQPGMVAVDIGAHGGFYTILARRKVGPSGRVVSFEPSPRERRRLGLNLMLNQFGDVTVLPWAVGERATETDFYIVQGLETGFGGRHRPAVRGRIKFLRVPLRTLDGSLAELNISAVDLVKVDVEGGELAVFSGAPELLSRHPRPIILCEVSDERSLSWGHDGRAVHDYLATRGFRWFTVEATGALVELKRVEKFHANLVAVPAERRTDIAELVHDG